MSGKHPRVLIFDSGVGGLSIFRELRLHLSHCELVFASDSAGFPYGTRSEASLIERVELVVDALIDQVQPDLMVVACNTASTVVLPGLRARYAIPLVGVVPAIKPAAELTKTGTIGLLATPATVARAYTRQLISDFAAHCQVLPLGTSELVYMAEAKLRGDRPDIDAIRAIIAPLFDPRHQPPMDTLVLACTHFPLLREELEQAAPRPLQWLDSGPAIARRVASLIAADQSDKNAAPVAGHRALFTGTAPLEDELRKALAGLDIAHIAQLDI